MLAHVFAMVRYVNHNCVFSERRGIQSLEDLSDFKVDPLGQAVIKLSPEFVMLSGTSQWCQSPGAGAGNSGEVAPSARCGISGEWNPARIAAVKSFGTMSGKCGGTNPANKKKGLSEVLRLARKSRTPWVTAWSCRRIPESSPTRNMEIASLLLRDQWIGRPARGGFPTRCAGCYSYCRQSQ